MKKSQGGALIIAILAVALVTASAVWLLRSQALWVKQSETLLTLAQGKQLLLAGVEWARIILAEDARHGSIDHTAEIWAKPLPPSSTEGWEITGAIEDAQSRFNVNNLQNNGRPSPSDIALFAAILQQTQNPPELAQALADWLDSDTRIGHGQEPEDAGYLALKPPYRSANQPLDELGDLAKIRGFTPQVIARLTPYITVLPSRTTINLNTTSAALLMTFIPGLTNGEAELMISRRNNAPFQSMADAKANLPRIQLQIPNGIFSLGSNYFRVYGRAASDGKQIGLEALISREVRLKPKIIWKRET